MPLLMNEGQECFYFLTVNHNPMKMEKENKRKKVGVLTPNVAFLIAGLLSWLRFQCWRQMLSL